MKGWIDRLNEAVAYIEAHLDDDISYEKAATIAGCSTYHFLRMFAYIADVPLSEYIRRRQLTKAAFDLRAGTKCWMSRCDTDMGRRRRSTGRSGTCTA